ncbi:MAG TPA: T9SS type A sorting domain-containing protein, partial [Candidatus Latescibacteria bacterium]|nr:T9SS type A sorting domain-containing protein [Candidatus Latescibacterota bacterium]
PQQAQLKANYPNPFNPETTIPMLVPAGQGPVRLLIYNAAGQQVRVLLDWPLSAGHHKIHWDGRDQAGRKMGSGVYLYRMETNTVAQTRSMTLLK